MKLLIVIPALNEEAVIEKNVIKLQKYLLDNLRKYDWKVVIADNNSSDQTGKIAKNLSIKFSRVYYFYLNKTGKGLAILSVWQKFDSDIYAFMDADFSTDIKALKLLVDTISKDGFDIAVGSRYIRGAKVERTLSRKIFSLGYRILLSIFFQLGVRDAPCGFKAVNKKVVQEVVPRIRNKKWFFDTEMLVLAQKNKMKIKEVPVSWRDHGTDSRVRALSLSWSYFKEVLRLFFGL